MSIVLLYYYYTNSSTALRWAFALFSFSILFTVGKTPWTGDQPVSRQLPIYSTTQTQNKRTQTSMLQVGFESTVPVFERAKTVHALDRARGHCDRRIVLLISEDVCFILKCPVHVSLSLMLHFLEQLIFLSSPYH
jgi:hypothetical protein